ncbi:MAG: dTDP-glucose 4,6-dehydratase [candidate division WOR-3 bacterium]
MKKIVVTGGAGFIGSNFIRYILKNRDYSIVNIDLLLLSGSKENIKEFTKEKRYEFVKGDIRDFDFLLQFFKKERDVYGVINFAAQSHVDRSIISPRDFIETNILGVVNLLEIFRMGFFKRFLQISTDEVYGDLQLDSKEKFTENSILKPNSPYSSSKASADLIALSYNKTYGLDIVITRSSNNFGPFQFPEKLIPLTILKAMKNEKIPVYGDGKNVRDWIYVEDNVRGILNVFENGKIGNIYNIGGNNEIENIKLVKMILKILKKDEKLITFVKDRPAHDRRYSLDCSKIEKELKHKNIFDFYPSLERTVKWYKKNLKWVEKCLDEDFKKYYVKNYREKFDEKN